MAPNLTTRSVHLAPLIVCLLCNLCASTSSAQSTEEAARRAVGFLEAEVPRWFEENRCHACHSAGDPARALMFASSLGFDLKERSLRDSKLWLDQPGTWNTTHTDAEFTDEKLSAIQFGFALTFANQYATEQDRRSLVDAARMIADFQEPDGRWEIFSRDTVGTPITYGRFLATAIAMKTLKASGEQTLETNIERAERWIRQQQPKTMLDAAGTLYALDDAQDEAAKKLRGDCLNLLEQGQGRHGGWGPYVVSPPEPFDTAIAVLALQTYTSEPKYANMIERGIEYLKSTQLEDGGWDETTRPPGLESYPLRIATAGWATLALLSTLEERKRQP